MKRRCRLFSRPGRTTPSFGRSSLSQSRRQIGRDSAVVESYRTVAPSCSHAVLERSRPSSTSRIGRAPDRAYAGDDDVPVLASGPLSTALSLEAIVARTAEPTARPDVDTTDGMPSPHESFGFDPSAAVTIVAATCQRSHTPPRGSGRGASRRVRRPRGRGSGSTRTTPGRSPAPSARAVRSAAGCSRSGRRWRRG